MTFAPVPRTQPSVSIVLPFFRSGNFLTEAIESVLEQRSFDNWRLFLIDDGSDDCDVEISREYRAKLPGKIELLEHKGQARRGISASRNLGILRSKGELVAFLDADDTWLPHKLLAQTSLLALHPEAGMVYGPALRWQSWNGGIDVDAPAEVDGFGTNCVVPGPALLDTFLRDEALTPCIGSVLIRRSLLMQAGLFEEQFWGVYDDQVLYAKLCHNSKVYVSNDCVSRYRLHKFSCCGRARTLGIGPSARRRFLQWLETYEESLALEAPELALSPR